MAKAVKQAEDILQDQPADVQSSKKKMSIAEAEEIVKRYEGINGINIPELKEAKRILKG